MPITKESFVWQCLTKSRPPWVGDRSFVVDSMTKVGLVAEHIVEGGLGLAVGQKMRVNLSAWVLDLKSAPRLESSSEDVDNSDGVPPKRGGFWCSHNARTRKRHLCGQFSLRQVHR